MRVRAPLCAPYTFLAQLVEQRSFKPQVAGSSPAGRTTCVLSSVGNHRFALPGAGEAKRGFPQRSKNARISESPKHFSATARRKSDGLLIHMPQVQVLQDAPQRQKKPAPFRFHGLRKCRENSIFAVSFFFSKPDPLRWAPVWDRCETFSKQINASLAQLVEQRTLNRKVVGSIPSRRTICTNGGIGIRARLRIWCPSWACEFDSHFVHHVPYHNGLCAFSKKKGGLQRSGAYRCRVAER